MEDYTPHFRTIYITDPSHDVSLASRYTTNIKFITAGDEASAELPSVIAKNLKDFNPSVDALIPMGKVITCLMVGLYISSMFGEPVDITIGIFRKDFYDFIEWSLSDATSQI
jgi:hypothetical protein